MQIELDLRQKKAEELFIREIPENMIEYRFFEALPSMSNELVHETYNDWKDEAYFDNEQYFRHQIYKPDEKDSSSRASTYKDENTEFPLVLDSPEINMKYELFKKWLEETKNSQASDTLESADISESEDDEFLDPLPVDKAEEEIDREVKDPTKNVVEVKNDDENDKTETNENKDEIKTVTIRPKTLKESLEEIQNNFRSAIETTPIGDGESFSRKTDATVRRTTSHCKGKAPAPPILQKSPSIPELSISRSVSPIPEKPSKKSGIFKSYLPSIFRSENKDKSTTTTTPVSTSEQYHLETEI